jgi:hypothetical protein
MYQIYKDTLSGCIFIISGLAFAIYALVNLRLGTMAQVGPGTFPLICGAALAALGLRILVRGMRSLPEQAHISWRALLLVTLSPIVFAILITRAGLVVTCVATIGVAILAKPGLSATQWIGTVVGLTVLCTLVFHYGLGVPIRLLPAGGFI